MFDLSWPLLFLDLLGPWATYSIVAYNQRGVDDGVRDLFNNNKKINII